MGKHEYNYVTNKYESTLRVAPFWNSNKTVTYRSTKEYQHVIYCHNDSTLIIKVGLED